MVRKTNVEEHDYCWWDSLAKGRSAQLLRFYENFGARNKIQEDTCWKRSDSILTDLRRLPDFIE